MVSVHLRQFNLGLISWIVDLELKLMNLHVLTETKANGNEEKIVIIKQWMVKEDALAQGLLNFHTRITFYKVFTICHYLYRLWFKSVIQ